MAAATMSSGQRRGNTSLLPAGAARWTRDGWHLPHGLDALDLAVREGLTAVVIRIFCAGSRAAVSPKLPDKLCVGIVC